MGKSCLSCFVGLVLLIACGACGNEEIDLLEEETTEAVIRVPDDIRSYNAVTKEIIFVDSPSVRQAVMGDSDRVTFRIAGGGDFSVTSILSLDSRIYNVPVLLEDFGKFYLSDGYPVVDVLRNGKVSQDERDEHMRKIRKEWERFLHVLSANGKLKE